MLLVHDERLLGLVDGWLAGVSGEAFTDVLPLLRRTFAEFEPGVRRSVGELVRRGPAAARRSTPGTGTGEVGLPGFGPGLDRTRANAAAGTVRLLLGRSTTVGLTDLEEPSAPPVLPAPPVLLAPPAPPALKNPVNENAQGSTRT
jgi:hypothetical protein